LEWSIEFLGGQGIICRPKQVAYRIHLHTSAGDKEIRIGMDIFFPMATSYF